MARFVVVYGSGEGHTGKIAEHIRALYEELGHQVELVHGKSVPADFDVADYDGVIVGASIHMGKHQKYMVNFARRYADALLPKLSAFFTVCLTAHSEKAADKAQVGEYIEEFIDATQWYPDQIGVFAGALLYTKYGLIKRFIMKRVSQQAGNATDTSRDYEYTDWESVDEFAEMFLAATVDQPVMADGMLV